MATYVDPTEDAWPHPSLIGDLMRKPPSERRAPVDDQLTVALAWLLDRWPVFARLCFEGDAEGEAALKQTQDFGARTWVTLPGLPGTTARTMYPDLSLAGSGAAFELLVESKWARSRTSTRSGPTLRRRPSEAELRKPGAG